MGVPKFFRYISERYPCLSELIKDYQIPEFDNLYLDMNGIIHNCSHPNDEDPHFRITEEKIFQDIFHYIEVLFRMIKPQRLFFMAVDGVAPRAKMNQQRGRRFRSAADALKAEAEAIKKGESLPTEARFDSNCITPGTVFMARLQEQLKYFVVDKISNDPLWQNCKVVLSGHETPGEGEHKIMDYIRYMRAQPGYDPNTRHCLYGLDADLIMLGLCTHEPHFSLLREEVKFGRKSTKRITVPEEITFFLLHLSLLREYLELEFAQIKYNLRGFEYDLEKIIDDWVLMGFLVGNDFIPHLPNLHITEGALPILYQTYMDVLPTLDGYINEGGKLMLARFETFMTKLGERDLMHFEEAKDDLLYMESKRGKKQTKDLAEWEDPDPDGIFFELEESKPAKDSGLQALLKSANEFCNDDDTEGLSDEDEFVVFKKDYYKEKLEYMEVTPEVLRDQAEGYVRAIQWNLNYYYNGCCSWSWFYPHHYAPYISDIRGFQDLNIEFDMGKPFLPYEQLLAVLPAASKQLLPDCYHSLMTDENSLIIDYYPEQFDCDLNGKKQAWEAVVKIPFINEERLLEAMSYCNDKLTTEEKGRNSHGPMTIYVYTPRNNGPYPAPCYFPEIPKNHTEATTMLYSDILVPRAKLIKGAYPGAHLNTYYPGFPTMKHLMYRGEISKAHVKVFEQPSRNESMIVHIIKDVNLKGDMVPVDLLGTSVFVGWPHLKEAKIVAISNGKRKFLSMGGPSQYNAVDLTDTDVKDFKLSINGVTENYKNRMGIDVSDTKVLVYVKEQIGRKFTFNSQGKLTFEKQFAEHTSNFPLQTVVYNIKAHDPHNNITKDVESIFPKNSICFTLANPYYGSQGVVQDLGQIAKTGRIKISISVLEEPNLSSLKEMHRNVFKKYKPAHHLASPLCISNVLFSRITGSIFIKTAPGSDSKSINIGLDLKLNKKNKETPGYTRKVNNYWFYTEKAADLVKEYMEKFPEVMEYLCRNSEDEASFETLFPMNSEEKVKELKQWLKSLPTESIEKQPCNSVGLEPEIILELEKQIDSFKSGNVKKVTMQVKPNFLYRPEVQTGTLEPDPKTETEILDRIVNVRHGYSVPFGSKGTITAIRNSSTNAERDTIYEVVFDKPFRDGMKLNCSDNRGYMLPKTAFINISYGQRLLVEKMGKPDELIANAEAANSKYFPNQNNPFNSLVRPQPSFQQQWFQPQQPSLFFPQGKAPLNQTNSAFAHVPNNSHRKELYVPPDKAQKNIQQFFNSDIHRGPDRQQSSKGSVVAQKKDVPGEQNKEGKENRNTLEQFFNNLIQQDLKKPPYSKDSNDSVKVEVTGASDVLKNHKEENKTSEESGKSEEPKESSASIEVTDNSKSNNGIKEEAETKVPTESEEIFKKLGLKVSTTPDWVKNSTNWRQQSNTSSTEKQQVESSKSDNFVLPTYRVDNKQSTKSVPKAENGVIRDKTPLDKGQTRMTVNTDFLKNILGIGKTTKRGENTENEATDDKENLVTNIPMGAKEEPKSSNVSFDMLAQVAKNPASVRLLTYYQSNQLGLPRYQYFPVENKMIRAQITINDGTKMFGDPAKSQEEASEKVAAVVLDSLLKKGNSLDQIAHKENLISNQSAGLDRLESVKQNNKSISSHNQKPTKREATAVLANSLVPLQAVKSHINKASSSNNRSSLPNEEPGQLTSSAEACKVVKKGVDVEQLDQVQRNTSQTRSKPRKERKTRIAANFLKKN